MRIDLLIGFTGDEHGNGGIELKHRTAIQPHEFLSMQIEIHHHWGIKRNPGIRKQAAVEFCGFFAVAVEPEAGVDIVGHVEKLTS